MCTCMCMSVSVYRCMYLYIDIVGLYIVNVHGRVMDVKTDTHIDKYGEIHTRQNTNVEAQT